MLKFFLRSFITMTLSAALFIALSSSAVEAQVTGTGKVNVSIPAVLVLSYYSQINVTLSAADMRTAIGWPASGLIDEGTIAAAPVGWAADLNIPSPMTGISPAANQLLTLTEAWAVRAIGNSGNSIQVATAVGNQANLTNVDGGTIVINDVNTRLSGVGGYGNSVTFVPTGPGSQQNGDMQFDLNLSGATRAGTYQDAGATYQFSITATSL